VPFCIEMAALRGLRPASRNTLIVVSVAGRQSVSGILHSMIVCDSAILSVQCNSLSRCSRFNITTQISFLRSLIPKKASPVSESAPWQVRATNKD